MEDGDADSVSGDIPSSVECRRRLAGAMAADDVAWWEIELATGELRFHERTGKLLGHPPDRLETIDQYQELVHPADRDRTVGDVEEFLADDTDRYETVYRIQTREGEYRWIRSVGTGVDEEGRRCDDPDYLVGVVTDVTERKRTQASLEESRRRLEQFAEHTTDVLWMVDADYEELVFVNSAYEDIWGRSVEDLRDDPQDFMAGIHPQDRPKVRDAMDRLAAGQEIDLEYRVNEAEDYGRWVWVVGAPVYEDGAVTRVLGFVRDVTDRKARERDLATFRTRFEAAMIAAEMTWWEMDVESETITLGERVDGLVGYPPGRFTDLEDWMELIHPEDLEQVVDRLEAHLADETDYIDVEYRLRTAAGDYRWMHATGLVTDRDETGAPSVLSGIVSDVSDLRDRERQLQVLDRVVRHNLRNDMDVIMGFAEEIYRESTGEVARLAERILDQGDVLIDTVEKEREIVEVVADRDECGDVDLGAAVEKAVADVRATFPGATVEVTMADPVTVRATNDLELAIGELVENAVEHSDRESPTARVRVETTDDRVTLRVADRGPGISDGEIQVLLGEREVDPLSHASGMGLWLVHWIVERSNGTLSFDENDPRGSVVTVELQRS